MTLKRRLTLWLGVALAVLWGSAAAILYADLQNRVTETLDQRLEASAQMVAGLVSRQPELLNPTEPDTTLVDPDAEGVACQIRAREGDVLLRTRGIRGESIADAEPGYQTTSIDGSTWRLFTLEHNGLSITTADRMEERDGLRNGIMLVLVAPFALALVGGVVVIRIGVHRGLAPLENLSREVSRRTPSALMPIDIGSAPAELRPVVSTLNELLERVNTSLQREQRFASQAAHELRTPLTAIKTHLQIATRQSSGNARDALAQAEVGLVRMQNVVEQLLMLARIEKQDDGTASFTDPGDAVEQALTGVAHPELVQVRQSSDLPSIAVPSALAVVAIRNVVENALKHGAPGQAVTLGLEAANGYVKVSILNTPADESTERTTTGEGLGLTLVNAIVQRYGATLDYDWTPDGHLRTSLHWPAVSHAAQSL